MPGRDAAPGSRQRATLKVERHGVESRGVLRSVWPELDLQLVRGHREEQIAERSDCGTVGGLAAAIDRRAGCGRAILRLHSAGACDDVGNFPALDASRV